MAVGDEAAAAGLPVAPATGDVRLGYVEINEVSDALARHQTSGTHPFTRITGQITGPQIANGAVWHAKIEDETIINSKIGPEAVSGGKIAAGAVSNTKILDNAVSESKIATAAVGRRALAKAYAAGTVTISSITGVVVETGLSGTVAMTVTSRSFSGVFYAVQQNTAGRFLIRASTENETDANTVSWIAVEVG